MKTKSVKHLIYILSQMYILIEQSNLNIVIFKSLYNDISIYLHDLEYFKFWLLIEALDVTFF